MEPVGLVQCLENGESLPSWLVDFMENAIENAIDDWGDHRILGHLHMCWMFFSEKLLIIIMLPIVK